MISPDARSAATAGRWQQSCRRLGLLAALCAVACEPLEDSVFEAKLVTFLVEPVRVPESAGVVQIPLRLQEPAKSAFEVSFEVQGLEAQDDCHQPDFQGARGTVGFDAGSDQAILDIWIGDDNLPETDERLRVVLSAAPGVTLLGPASFTVTIEDDDRDALLDAASYGVVPNTGADQTVAMQAAMDRAAELGRAVLMLEPGQYEVRSVEMTAGTTLSARGASFLRPPASEPEMRTLRVHYAGAENSPPTLIEGLSIDGRRDAQGAYQGYEQENAHLIMLEGAPDQPGRLNATVQHVSVTSGTGDGIAVGPDSEVSMCHIQGHDIWRDVISLHGGRSSLKVRDLDASASEGTSGIWLDGHTPGYDDIRTVDVEIEDARLNSGDVEMEVLDGSRVVLRRLSMTEPPFRVLAPDSTVLIVDSVIQIGVPSERHNNFTLAHDVRLLGTTIVSSERIDEEAEFPELVRTFATLSARFRTEEMPDPSDGDHLMLVDNCRFMLDEDVEPTDTVYAVSSTTPGGAIEVRNSELGEGYAGWFAPGCQDCILFE